MRIGFDAKRAFLNRTGLGNYSRNIIGGLEQLCPEFDYYLFTPQVSNLFSPGQSSKVISPRYLKKVSVLWRILKVALEAEKNDVQIFHGLTSELPFGISRKGIKTIVTVHDLIFLRYPHLYNSADAFIYKKKTLYACTSADKVIAISEQTKEDLINFLSIPAEKIEVIYQDCHEIFQTDISNAIRNEVKQRYQLPDNFILSVGTIEERKNHILILKALQLLDDTYQLVIVGKSGGYKDILEKFIQANQLQHRVKFLEYIEFNHLPAVYSLAKVFAYPSVFEGFGIPILEALNCGTPVITSEGSCFLETGGDAALYTDPQNHEQLAHLIRQVYEDSSLSQQMVEKGKKHAAVFRKEVTIPQLAKLYKSLL